MPLFERDEAEYTSEAHAQALTGTPVENAFVENFFSHLAQSHDHGWCRESLDAYLAFARDGMGGSLGTVLDVIGQLRPENGG